MVVYLLTGRWAQFCIRGSVEIRTVYIEAQQAGYLLCATCNVPSFDLVLIFYVSAHLLPPTATIIVAYFAGTSRSDLQDGM